MKFVMVLVVATLVLGGCAGKVNYRPPSAVNKTTNTVTVNSPRNEVWKRIIPSLGSSFFVVNNLDKDSGFINVSYSGSPEKYIDCGYIESYVKNARGERNYNFPAATAYKEYETFQNGTQLLFIRRKMNLEGRINIVVQEMDDISTLISVNTKYVVTKSGTIRGVQGGSHSFSDSISFNTNGSASFPQQTTCHATGALEKEVLKALNL
ncbi:MAG: hypothetical protein HOL17_05535 [Gammaproteobacteria bacterium]|jgi:PBP1b-binding outer membrane lipoprotein LpoB|nr:hypothetical protein [Gammaproteobacteria bacterium]